ncbi:MAG: hypothetical protein QXE31_04315 [Candidatus Woesearchaeota archaeon]
MNIYSQKQNYGINVERNYEIVKFLISSHLNIDLWPKPYSKNFNYQINGTIKSLSDLGYEDLQEVIEQLNAIIDIRHLSDLEKIILARSACAALTISWDFKECSPKKRKYGPALVVSHPITVAAMLGTTDFLVILAALSHDTIEDSPQHKILIKYYKGKELTKEEIDLVGLTDSDLNPKRSERKKVYDKLLIEFIDTYIKNLGIMEEKKKEILRFYLNALTHRGYVGYNKYIIRMLCSASKKLNINDFSGYYLILIKGYDKWDNTNSKPKYGTAEEIKKARFNICKDAFKLLLIIQTIDYFLFRFNRRMKIVLSKSSEKVKEKWLGMDTVELSSLYGKLCGIGIKNLEEILNLLEIPNDEGIDESELKNYIEYRINRYKDSSPKFLILDINKLLKEKHTNLLLDILKLRSLALYFLDEFRKFKSLDENRVCKLII